MIPRLQTAARALLRALILWGILALLSLIATCLVLLLGALIAQPSGTFFNPAYALAWLPVAAVLPGYLLYGLLTGFIPALPALLRRGWLPSLLGVLGVLALGFLQAQTQAATPFYIRSAVDMAPQALYALQGLVVVLVVLGEGLAGLWAQKTAQPATAGSPELVK
jgi:hypothetical protein